MYFSKKLISPRKRLLILQVLTYNGEINGILLRNNAPIKELIRYLN